MPPVPRSTDVRGQLNTAVAVGASPAGVSFGHPGRLYCST
jgi:hypothetical protein